ncbi:MAG: sulfotransferase [Halioglobus sp.]
MTEPNTNVKDAFNAARGAMQAEDYRTAHQLCLSILKADPTFADAWFFCAVIAASNGLPAKAIEILDRALGLAPSNPEYHAEKGKHLLALHELEQAIHHANLAWKEAPEQLPVLNTLGTVFSRAGEHASALLCYEKAIHLLGHREGKSSLPPQWIAELHFNHAASLQFSGRFAEAQESYEAAITLAPNYFKAHSSLSTVRHQSEDDNHLARLDGLKDAAKTPQDQLHLGHAIAKELEDLGQYEAALDSLIWAKEKQKECTGYHFDEDLALFSAIKEIYSVQNCQPFEATCSSSEPIFIVGMPRTGTTLVEQILASHSNVFAAGELQNFPLQVKKATQTTSPDVLDLETLITSEKIDRASLGDAYLQSTRPRTGHTKHFIDKLPINFMYLGAIARALPNAKIICLRRDPMDTCLSNYRQLFALDFKHYHYNYDLLACGQYFVEFDKLMQHWQTVLPNRIHEVQYEELVNAPEQTAKALVSHCQLDWEPACLEFHTRKTAVATPSAVQVRQGIYQSSVNRWQRYGNALDPLYDLLRSEGFYSR